jgi:uncharacterized protein (DUF1697 family)
MANVRLVALLRAINVGGHTVKMTRLQECFALMGFPGARTVIASGNVIFETTAKKAGDRAQLETEIAEGLEYHLDFPVGTFLRTPEELREVATSKYARFAESSTTGLYVVFVHGQPNKDAKARLTALNSEIDEFVVAGSEIFWSAKKGVGGSLITPARLERAIGGPGTTRNITTVRKLAEKAAVG